VGPRNHVLDGVQISPIERGNSEGEGRSIVKYRDTAVSSANRDAVWLVGLNGPKVSCIRWGPDAPWEMTILRVKR